MKQELSATMVACIDMALENGGELVRYQGGYWAPRGAHPRATHTPSHGTPTVEGLVRRGQAEYTEWHNGKFKVFPVAMRLTPQATAEPEA